MLVWLSIKFIQLYQILAPTRIRESCRFEPTCSHYSILVLKKYGFLKGWKMTFNRLGRCKYPNDGEDFP